MGQSDQERSLAVSSILCNREPKVPAEGFTFSRQRIKQVDGHDPFEHDYVFRYCEACVEAIEAASLTLTEIADGRHPFDGQLQALMSSQMTRIRFHTRALEEAAHHFEHLPGLARIFKDAFNQTRDMVTRAHEDHWQVRHLYDTGAPTVSWPVQRKAGGGRR